MILLMMILQNCKIVIDKINLLYDVGLNFKKVIVTTLSVF